MKNPRKWLRVLLALLGCGLLLATVPIFFPVSLMATIHGWLALGEFPDRPITIYLARSTSLLYAIHGLLILIVSFNLERYWPLVPVFGWLHVVIGLLMLGIDLTAPMPWYWTAAEGIPISIAGLVIIWLYRQANSLDQQSSS